MYQLIRLMRPGDWSKNAFVLLALMFWLPSQAGVPLTDLQGPIVSTILTFIAFSLVASGFYCFNDCFDAEKDRRHPIKRRRPVACGAVSPGTAMFLGAVLLIVGSTIAAVVNLSVGVVLVVYALMQVGYNAKLKYVMFLDVITIATGFGLRAAAGALAIDVQISIWLVGSVFFLTLYIGFVKRLADLTSARMESGSQWKSPAGYNNLDELNWLLGLSACLAIVTYLMYSLSEHAAMLFGARSMGFALLSPLVLLVIHRFYHRALTGKSDSPISSLWEDGVVTVSCLCFLVGTLMVLYVPIIGQVLQDVFFYGVPGIPTP
ncbi:MAG: hypothetical protein CMJ32_09460 [Phycisphaerae bacterium]|nr:hypothetical protein [Phycisphaerae bacterium]